MIIYLRFTKTFEKEKVDIILEYLNDIVTGKSKVLRFSYCDSLTKNIYLIILTILINL